MSLSLYGTQNRYLNKSVKGEADRIINCVFYFCYGHRQALIMRALYKVGRMEEFFFLCTTHAAEL